jgi:hypothetical protein
MEFNSPADSILFDAFFGAISLLILIAIYAAYSVPLSIIEWHLFYGKSIFKNKWQVLKINMSSLLLTALCSYVFFVFFRFTALIYPLRGEWLEYAENVILVGMPFVLFLLIKLWSIGFMSQKRILKIQLFLFNLLSTTLFFLIIYLSTTLFSFTLFSLIIYLMTNLRL